jgi:hypothetical protein
MSDRPYTDADLRAEAARQLAAALEGDYDDDYMDDDAIVWRVGKRMAHETIQSRATWSSRAWWHSLRDEPDGGEHFKQAARAIHDLLTQAADCSEWAVALGADGLKPDGGFTIGPDGAPTVCVLFAFHPDVTGETRRQLVAQLAHTAITTN